MPGRPIRHRRPALTARPGARRAAALAAWLVAAAGLGLLPAGGPPAIASTTSAGPSAAAAAADPGRADPGADGPALPQRLAQERYERCEVPAEFDADADRLPQLARALKAPAAPLTIVVLGPQTAGGARDPLTGSIAYPPRLQAMLSTELAADLRGRTLAVEAITKPRGTTEDLAALIPTRVLPLKPALVIWQVGRADARQGHSPHRFSAALTKGIELLHGHGVDTILMDIQYHPQFEALYRTDDYRRYLRWLAGKRNLPLLRRYQMIEYWIDADRIDLDSGLASVQRRSSDFIQDCVAWQATRMIVEGVALARRP